MMVTTFEEVQVEETYEDKVCGLSEVQMQLRRKYEPEANGTRSKKTNARIVTKSNDKDSLKTQTERNNTHRHQRQRFSHQNLIDFDIDTNGKQITHN